MAPDSPTVPAPLAESLEGLALADYVVVLVDRAAPEPGPPGGPRPLQELELRPRRPGLVPVTAGTVNSPEKHAELRTFEHASLAHQVRFGQRLRLSLPEWEQLLQRAEVALQCANIEVARVGPPPQLLRAAREHKRARRTSPRATALFLVITALAAAVALLAARKLLLP
jgi:hypothetical protein